MVLAVLRTSMVDDNQCWWTQISRVRCDVSWTSVVGSGSVRKIWKTWNTANLMNLKYMNYRTKQAGQSTGKEEQRGIFKGLGAAEQEISEVNQTQIRPAACSDKSGCNEEHTAIQQRFTLHLKLRRLHHKASSSMRMISAHWAIALHRGILQHITNPGQHNQPRPR